MSVTEAIKNTITAVTETAKIADLQRDIIDQSSYARKPALTTDHGVKISDHDNWYGSAYRHCMRHLTVYSCRLKAVDGTRTGPSLLEDQIAREKIHRFDHERIPGQYSIPFLAQANDSHHAVAERVVHARGAGAHGYFKLLNEHASEYTYAPVLTDTSRTTPTFVRFSTVQGSRGSAVSLPLSLFWRICLCHAYRIRSAMSAGSP